MKGAFTQIALITFLGMSFSGLQSDLAPSPALAAPTVGDRKEDEVAAHFTRPWAQRRGIESIDRNDTVTLVRVPLNQLSDALAAKAIETRRNVLGSEIKVSGYFWLAYQIVGQEWSTIVTDAILDPDGTAGTRVFPIPSPARLSKQLKQPVITLITSDTSSLIRYELFEGGELVEYFAAPLDETADKMNDFYPRSRRYVLPPDPNANSTAKQIVYFWSRRRQVTATQIGNARDFVDRFMRESNAYDPAIDSRYFLSEYFLKPGNRYKVQNPGFTLVLNPKRTVKSVPELVRVDYFRYGD
ncbi:MAG: hypothetical protein ACAF41_25480 [Leptolyngbya sp. BL-A-14]